MGAASRRRKQFANGFRHLAKLGRPIYRRHSDSFLTKKLRDQISKERLIANRKGRKK